ncbi:hypothetical protein [Candidatus Lokiarchaeum ossiferum]|uniref:hypothetical protein n=1 Tax=Candidatus Lokiarchaeum ossiferum TaxID=2951803 RepID=UPI00352CADAE
MISESELVRRWAFSFLETKKFTTKAIQTFDNSLRYFHLWIGFLIENKRIAKVHKCKTHSELVDFLWKEAHSENQQFITVWLNIEFLGSLEEILNIETREKRLTAFAYELAETWKKKGTSANRIRIQSAKGGYAATTIRNTIQTAAWTFFAWNGKKLDSCNPRVPFLKSEKTGNVSRRENINQTILRAILNEMPVKYKLAAMLQATTGLRIGDIIHSIKKLSLLEATYEKERDNEKNELIKNNKFTELLKAEQEEELKLIDEKFNRLIKDKALLMQYEGYYYFPEITTEKTGQKVVNVFLTTEFVSQFKAANNLSENSNINDSIYWLKTFSKDESKRNSRTKKKKMLIDGSSLNTALKNAIAKVQIRAADFMKDKTLTSHGLRRYFDTLGKKQVENNMIDYLMGHTVSYEFTSYNTEYIDVNFMKNQFVSKIEPNLSIYTEIIDQTDKKVLKLEEQMKERIQVESELRKFMLKIMALVRDKSGKEKLDKLKQMKKELQAKKKSRAKKLEPIQEARDKEIENWEKIEKKRVKKPKKKELATKQMPEKVQEVEKLEAEFEEKTKKKPSNDAKHEEERVEHSTKIYGQTATENEEPDWVFS